MKIRFRNLLLIGSIVASVVFVGCEKDDENVPLARFGASQTNIEEGMSIIFTDSSTYVPCSWMWTFGDGSISAEQNPSHIYDSEGVFTVSLTVSNAYGSNTETKTDYITVSLNSSIASVTDIDGNTYMTVKIGDQIWMAEDLKTTHYPNGDAIPHITDSTAWDNLENSNIDDAYCFYDNDNTTVYGALYTYAAAIADNWARDNSTVDSVGGQGVCPDGWHLPIYSEWTTLIDYLGGENLAGGKMKESGTLHWNSPNTGATNSSGFTALPGGMRVVDGGTFYRMSKYGFWWIGTEYSNSLAHICFLYKADSQISLIVNDKSYGLSVRCIRN